MNNKIILSRKFAASISLAYFLFSVVLITAIYYVAPLIILNWYSFFERIGADIPWLTYFVLHKYSSSYILNIAILYFSARFYMHNEKSGVNIKSFVFLNISLLVCIVWFALVIFALQIPIQQMANIK